MRPVLALHADEGERIAEDEQVGQKVGQEANHDQRWREDHLPRFAQRSPRVNELDDEKWEQREPGEAGGGGEASQHPRNQPTLPSRREDRAEGERAKEGFRVTDQRSEERRV